MSGLSEAARSINALCDMAADKFAGSIHGRINPVQVRRDLLAARMQGCEIRRKTAAEIAADCARIDGRRRKKPRGRNGYSKQERRAIVDAVERKMAEGTGFLEACRLSGTTDKSYYKFVNELRRKPAKVRRVR